MIIQVVAIINLYFGYNLYKNLIAAISPKVIPPKKYTNIFLFLKDLDTFAPAVGASGLKNLNSFYGILILSSVNPINFKRFFITGFEIPSFLIINSIILTDKGANPFKIYEISLGSKKFMSGFTKL